MVYKSKDQDHHAFVCEQVLTSLKHITMFKGRHAFKMSLVVLNVTYFLFNKVTEMEIFIKVVFVRSLTYQKF